MPVTQPTHDQKKTALHEAVVAKLKYWDATVVIEKMFVNGDVTDRQSDGLVTLIENLAVGYPGGAGDDFANTGIEDGHVSDLEQVFAKCKTDATFEQKKAALHEAVIAKLKYWDATDAIEKLYLGDDDLSDDQNNSLIEHIEDLAAGYPEGRGFDLANTAIEDEHVDELDEIFA